MIRSTHPVLLLFLLFLPFLFPSSFPPPGGGFGQLFRKKICENDIFFPDIFFGRQLLEVMWIWNPEVWKSHRIFEFGKLEDAMACLLLDAFVQSGIQSACAQAAPAGVGARRFFPPRCTLLLHTVRMLLCV